MADDLLPEVPVVEPSARPRRKGVTVLNRDWRPFFPKPHPRGLQAKVLDRLTANWDKYNNFVLELPTGVGKSDIAITLGRWLASQPGNHSYYISPSSGASVPTYQDNYQYITTTSKALQEQYEVSFKKEGLLKLWSADNFKCNRGKDLSCSDGRRICKATKKECPGGLCPYKVAKAEFIAAEYGIMNLAYYVNESYYAGQLPARGALIMDEGHTVGEFVRGFVTIEISDESLAKWLLKPPVAQASGIEVDSLVQWIQAELLPKVQNYMARLSDKLDGWTGSYETADYMRLVKEHTDLDKYLCRLNRVTKKCTSDNWVAERKEKAIFLKPLKPTEFMEEVVTGNNDKNVFMSATILNPTFFMKEFGLDPQKTLVLTAPSPFPVNNRLIRITPQGKLEHNNLTETMKPHAARMKEVLAAHAGQRGIVFVSSYAQAAELVRQVGDRRLITHASSGEKAALFKRHAEASDTVLVSPSMHEGVDLKDDLSRFWVLLKMPFPSLGALDIKRRCEIDPQWYAYTTALNLIQCSGRSVRSETDYATGYIFDGSFPWWYKKWEHMLPAYWKESLIFED